MIKIFIFSLLSIINITKSDNDRLSRFFNSQLYDLYIDEYKKHENQNGNKIIYHNNYLISILKSDRSKNFKHQFRSEIENFINTNPKNLTEDLISEYGIYEFSNNRFNNSIKFLSNINSERSNYFLGLSYYYLGDYNKALEWLSNQRKTSEELNFILGVIYYQINDFVKSIKYFDDLSDLYKSKKIQYLISINFLLGKFDEVLDYESELSENTENLDYSLYFIGKSHLINENYKKSIDNFLKIKSDIDRGDEIKYLTAYSYYMNGDLEIAKNKFNELTKFRTNYKQLASYYIGSIFFKEGDYNTAKNYFYASYRENQDVSYTKNSLLNYSKCLFELGNYNLSIKTLEKLKSEFSDYKLEEVNELISENYFLTNDYERILNYLNSLENKSNKEKQKYKFILYQKGVKNFNNGDFKNAIKYFRLSSEIDVENIDLFTKAVYGMAEAYFITNQYEKSKTLLSNHLVKKSNYNKDVKLKSLKLMGYTLFNMNDYSNSANYFNSYLKNKNINSPVNIDNEDLDVFIRMGDSYYASKSYRKSLAVYNDILESKYLDKNYIIYQIALCHYGLNEYQKSFVFLDRVIANSNKSLLDDAIFRKAQIYFETSEFGKAIEFYSEIIDNIKFSKYLPYAYLNRSTSYFNLKSYDQAEKDFLFILENIDDRSIQSEALLGMQKVVSFTDNFTLLNRQISSYRSKFPDNNEIQKIEYENIRNLYFNQKYTDLIQQVNTLDSLKKTIINRNEINYYLAESYFKTNNFLDAEKIYLNISDSINSKYLSRSLNRLASINLTLKNYDKSIKYYKNLQNISKNNREKIESFVGILSNYFYLENFDSVLYYSQKVNEFDKISFNNRNKINLLSAKSYLKNNNSSAGIDMLLKTVNLVKDESAAEANLMLAKIFFERGQTTQALETLYSLNENFQSYPYWVGKSYITIGEIFISENDNFQAEATLLSIVENTIIEEIKNEAQELLNKINSNETSL